MDSRKTVFITGTTGGMGGEGLRCLLERSDRFRIRTLARPSQKNKEKMAKYQDNPGLEILWGDLQNYEDVLAGVTGADYVLHVGAFVSPFCDEHPIEAYRTNVGSTKNIIRAIKAQENPDGVKLVYIGTIDETGTRMAPIHYGRIGDPINGSIYDYYAVSKIAAEREVIESGLRHWVSLRQSAIIPFTDGAGEFPIITHQPLNNVVEAVTREDSGRLLANVCEGGLPEEFWRKAYNIGGGKTWRVTPEDSSFASFDKMGIDYRQVYDPNWFALTNFHGQCYLDSDVLNDYLHFRTLTFQEYEEKQAELMKFQRKNSPSPRQMPTAEQLRAHIMEVIRRPMGVLHMVENNITEQINVFFGSRARYEAIPSEWSKMILYHPAGKPVILSHGYDESKPDEELDIEDVRQAAQFRGGKCLSASMKKGDLFTPLRFCCAFGHEFEATPNLVLKTGHWCPECERLAWNCGEMARVNPFFAQVWYPLHDTTENERIPKVTAGVALEI